MLKWLVVKIEYILVDEENRNEYKNRIVEYYNRYFPEESNKLIAKHSDLFWLAIKDKELVGVTRMLTDFSRYALLLDLIVRKSKRNQGIGKTLVKLAEKYCKDQGISHLILTTDSRTDWLTGFYEKVDFKVVTDQTLMEYKL